MNKIFAKSEIFQKVSSRLILKILIFCLALNMIIVNLKLFWSKHFLVTKKIVDEKNEFQDDVSYKIPSQFLGHDPHHLHQHQFKYLLEPSIDERCLKRPQTHQRNLIAVILIHSSSEHFRHRDVIRNTWGSIGSRISKVRSVFDEKCFQIDF